MQHVRTFMVALLVTVVAALVPAQALAKTGTTTTTVKSAATTKKATSAKTKTKKKVASSNSIVQTCQRSGDTLSGHYNLAALRKAYTSIPVAVREYTSCAQVILDKISSESPKLKAPASKSKGGSGFPVIIVLIIVVLLIGGGGAFYSYRRSQGTSEGSEQ